MACARCGRRTVAPPGGRPAPPVEGWLSMSETRSPDAATRAQPRRTHWTGLVFFAAVMMILLGFFQAIEGLAAIFNDDYYHVTQSGLLVNVDYSVWGWVHLLLG